MPSSSRLLRRAATGLLALSLSACSLPGGCQIAPADAPDAGALFGVNLNWGEETLQEFSERMGFAPAVAVSFAGFPMSEQEIEWFGGAVDQVEQEGGTLLLTLEPHDGLRLDQDDVDALAERLAEVNERGVPVIVRFAHEMNGSWYEWGQQPEAYVAAFRQVADAVHDTPASTMMWAANYGGGYPFTGGRYESKPDAADFGLLDLDGNGRLTMADDPYAPYYPGDEYVDWVGMSLYHWGDVYPWGENELPEDDKFVSQLRGEYRGAGGDDTVLPDFYGTYGEQHGKPVAIPETSALFNTNAGGPDELDIKQRWWRQVFGGQTAAQLPLLKMINWFDWRKDEVEIGGEVDWRVSGKVRDEFLADLPDDLEYATGRPRC